MEVAIAVYPGVFADECWAFDAVCRRIPDSHVVTVGHRPGAVPARGGRPQVAHAFGEVRDADVVVVPGGFGCPAYVRDRAFMGWLADVGARSSWLLASSTGNVLLAASGLTGTGAVATHWFAVPLLEEHGARGSDDRVVIDGRVLTCRGSVSALEIGLHVAEVVGGHDLVARIRSEIAASLEPGPDPSTRRRLAQRLARRRRDPPTTIRVDLGELRWSDSEGRLGTDRAVAAS